MCLCTCERLELEQVRLLMDILKFQQQLSRKTALLRNVESMIFKSDETVRVSDYYHITGRHWQVARVQSSEQPRVAQCALSPPHFAPSISPPRPPWTPRTPGPPDPRTPGPPDPGPPDPRLCPHKHTPPRGGSNLAHVCRFHTTKDFSQFSLKLNLFENRHTALYSTLESGSEMGI